MQEKGVLKMLVVVTFMAQSALAHTVTRDALGTTIVAHLASAPYPDGKEPYTDDTVVIFVPRHLTLQGSMPFLLYLHGHRSTALGSVEALRVREQLVLSRKDAVLVAPQGPYLASDSSTGKLGRDGGLARLLGDVLGVLATEKLASAGAAVGAVVVCAHSGGFEGAADVAKRGGVPVGQVILLDGLYGRFEDFAEWVAADGTRRLASLVTEGGRPDERTMYLKGSLRKRGVTWLDERVEGRSSRRQLMRARVLLLNVRLGHVECGYVHLALRDLLMVGPLAHRGTVDWYRRPSKRPRTLERYRAPE